MRQVTRVKKRTGKLEEVDLNKVLNSIKRVCPDLEDYVDFTPIATKTVSKIYDGVTTRILDLENIQTAAYLIVESPIYSKVAARLLANFIRKDVEQQDIISFSDYIEFGYSLNLISDNLYFFVKDNAEQLDKAINTEYDKLFEYFGLKTVYDRYLLRHPTYREVIETPQYWLMRVACGLSNNAKEAIEFYNLIASHECMPSTPTLFNSGTAHSQMSSCYLLDSPQDNLTDIYKRYADIAQLSKWAGGIGLSYSRIRGKGSLINGTNGITDGIIKPLKVLDSSVVYVNQCLHPHTSLYTADGIKKIEDIIKNKDLVLTEDGTYRKVLNVYKYPSSRDVINIKTAHNFDNGLTVTDQHPIYSMNISSTKVNYEKIQELIEKGKIIPKWQPAKKIEFGSLIAIQIPQESIDTDITTEELYLTGVMLSAAKIVDDQIKLTFTLNKEDDIVNKVVKYLENNNISFSRGVQLEKLPIKEFEHIVFDKKDFKFNIFDSNGNKYINKNILHLPTQKLAYLLTGMIETTGITNKEAVIFTEEKQLLEYLKYILLKFRVLPTFSCKEFKISQAESTKKKVEIVRKLVEDSTHNKYFKIQFAISPVLAECANIDISNIIPRTTWLDFNDKLWTKVQSVSKTSYNHTIYDLKIDSIKSYTTTYGLVHNGGKRKGAACVYLEPWHTDIEDFLILRKQTGDIENRTFNLNLALWIPDLFMERVEQDANWSLFSPDVTPDLPDLYGSDFKAAYLMYEQNKYIPRKTVSAKKLYVQMLKMLAETGNGWMCFKDACNEKSNQVNEATKQVVHSSNLCTEIIEVTGKDQHGKEQVAVCNLSSINISKYVNLTTRAIDYEKLAKNVQLAVKFLDKVIDRNFYPIPEAEYSNKKWRPIGLGLMGLQDLFFKLNIPFDSQEAIRLSRNIQEVIYYNALKASMQLAKTSGKVYEEFEFAWHSEGILHFDLCENFDNNFFLGNDLWEQLKEEIQEFGVKNSLLIAIAPTATIADITGCYSCIEPQVSNIFKHETLSGEFIVVNKYLVSELQKHNLWTEDIRNKIIINNGSIQNIEEIPINIREVYKTVWEVKQKALIDHAVARGFFIDQSQSLNLFLADPTLDKLASMYMYAWKQGIKTTYYLRSRPKSEITKTLTIDIPEDEICESCT